MSALDWGSWEAWVAVAGMALLTVITRGFFSIPERELPLPAWLHKGLRYAPLAALAAIVVPGVVMHQGQLVDTVLDARVLGALAGAAYYFWRRGMLGTIVVGSSVMLSLRLGLGW
jgi:branched-subunit amino acid transport protein